MFKLLSNQQTKKFIPFGLAKAEKSEGNLYSQEKNPRDAYVSYGQASECARLPLHVYILLAKSTRHMLTRSL